MPPEFLEFFDRPHTEWTGGKFLSFMKTKKGEDVSTSEFEAIWNEYVHAIATQQPSFQNFSNEQVEAARIILRRRRKCRIKTQLSANNQVAETSHSNPSVHENTTFTLPPSKRRRILEVDSVEEDNEDDEGDGDDDDDDDGDGESDDEGDDGNEAYHGINTTPSDPPGLSCLGSEVSLRSVLRVALEKGKTADSTVTAKYASQNNLFIDDPFFVKVFNPVDYETLRNLFRATPRCPKAFDVCMEAMGSYISSRNFRDLPAVPSSLEASDDHIWGYVFGAVRHLVQFYHILIQRSQSHAEVYHEVNIWGPILDVPFLSSSTITLDRKEVKANQSGRSSRGFDGILRSVGSSLCRFDYGYIEVKPNRVPHPKCSDPDRDKIIAALRAALCKIRSHLSRRSRSMVTSLQTTDEIMRHVVVVGILCNGLTVTLLRACNPYGDVFLTKETNVIEIQNDYPTLRSVLQHCWRTRLLLEATHEVVDAALKTKTPDYD